MKNIYKTPSIKIASYSTIDRTNVELETSQVINQQYSKISANTFKLNDMSNLNS